MGVKLIELTPFRAGNAEQVKLSTTKLRQNKEKNKISEFWKDKNEYPLYLEGKPSSMYCFSIDSCDRRGNVRTQVENEMILTPWKVIWLSNPPPLWNFLGLWPPPPTPLEFPIPSGVRVWIFSGTTQCRNIPLFVKFLYLLSGEHCKCRVPE